MIILHDETGRPFATVNDPIPPDYEEFLQSEGTAYVIAPEDANGIDLLHSFHVAAGILLPRPQFDAPDTLSLAVNDRFVLRLPIGTMVSLDGSEPIEVPTGELELESDTPADYELALYSWPYIEKTVQVTVHEA